MAAGLTGKLYINGDDAWTTWGVGLEDGSLGELMAPPPVKAPIVNESRLENGKRYITNNHKYDERVVTLVFFLVASNVTDYVTNYRNFISTLATSDTVELITSNEPDVCYRLVYGSCSQFRQYFGGMAKIAVKFIEPDPTNRTIST